MGSRWVGAARLRFAWLGLGTLIIGAAGIPDTLVAQQASDSNVEISITGLRRLDGLLRDPVGGAKSWLEGKMRESSNEIARWFGRDGETMSAVARNIYRYQDKNARALGSTIRDFENSDGRELDEAWNWSTGEGLRQLADDAKDAVKRRVTAPFQRIVEGLDERRSELERSINAAEYARDRVNAGMERGRQKIAALQDYLDPETGLGLEPGSGDATAIAKSFAADPRSVSEEANRFVADLPIAKPNQSAASKSPVVGTLEKGGVLSGVLETNPALRKLLAGAEGAVGGSAASVTFASLEPAGAQFITTCPDGSLMPYMVKDQLVWSPDSISRRCANAKRGGAAMLETGSEGPLTDSLLQRALAPCPECAPSSGGEDGSRVETGGALREFGTIAAAGTKADKAAEDARRDQDLRTLAEQYGLSGTGARGVARDATATTDAETICPGISARGERVEAEFAPLAARIARQELSICQMLEVNKRHAERIVALYNACPRSPLIEELKAELTQVIRQSESEMRSSCRT